jgi:hypothetical protein
MIEHFLKEGSELPPERELKRTLEEGAEIDYDEEDYWFAIAVSGNSELVEELEGSCMPVIRLDHEEGSSLSRPNETFNVTCGAEKSKTEKSEDERWLERHETEYVESTEAGLTVPFFDQLEEFYDGIGGRVAKLKHLNSVGGSSLNDAKENFSPVLEIQGVPDIFDEFSCPVIAQMEFEYDEKCSEWVLDYTTLRTNLSSMREDVSNEEGLRIVKGYLERVIGEYEGIVYSDDE